jgi:hypothetical protein
MTNQSKSTSSSTNLKSGFGKFVSSIKIFLPKETIFALENVMLQPQSKLSQLQTQQTNSVTRKAENYIQSYLTKHQDQFNTDKNAWLDQAKNYNKTS